MKFEQIKEACNKAMEEHKSAPAVTVKYFKLRDVKTGREFLAEYSDIAGEWYEKFTGEAHSSGDVQIINKSKGGARPGAGRPRSKAPRQSITFSVSRLCVEEARDLRFIGLKVNKIVEDAIRAAWEEHL